MPPPLAVDQTGNDAVASAVSVVAETSQPTDPTTTASVSLTGRTVYIGSGADIGNGADLGQLKPGEVVLTFDDGPDPAVTPKVLEILDAYQVKAVFFMVGKMAKTHAATAQLVANDGQTIGSHSYGHENFSKVGYDKSMVSVAKAEVAINDALAPIGQSVSPFFRFPYMASTAAVSASLKEAGWTIFSFDADSWDYLKQAPDKILKRTLKRLDDKGGGIVLFHDIHARILDVLPAFLDALKERGFKVVRVLPKNPDILTATAAGKPA
jgi:peptidoglycan/xylan/chitin deacetylase (PgdA/CDA1 family)